MAILYKATNIVCKLITMAGTFYCTQENMVTCVCRRRKKIKKRIITPGFVSFIIESSTILSVIVHTYDITLHHAVRNTSSTMEEGNQAQWKKFQAGMKKKKNGKNIYILGAVSK